MERIRILPSISTGWASVNLNDFSKTWLRHHHPSAFSGPNPLLDSAVCQRMVKHLARLLHVGATYGGWLEERPDLWKGSYLGQGVGYMHLGVDFNVPAGTPVVAPERCTVVRIDDDHPERHGWGPRVIVRLSRSNHCAIFAHLDPDVRCTMGQELGTGVMLGKVGTQEHNGQWYEHLHVQMVEANAYAQFGDGLEKLDGYANPDDVSRWAKICPDPMPFVAFG